MRAKMRKEFNGSFFALLLFDTPYKLHYAHWVQAANHQSIRADDSPLDKLE